MHADLTTLRLREASVADAEFIYRLVEKTMRGYVEKIWGDFSEEHNRKNIAAIIAAGRCSVIQLGTEDIGAVSVDRASKHIKLDQLYVAPAYQNKGIGTRLLRELTQEAKVSAAPLRLRVLVGNPAFRLYEREGFRVTSRTPQRIYMEWGGDAWIDALLDSCGVPRDAISSRGLPLHFEAQELVEAEVDANGRAHLLVAAAAAAWREMKAAAASRGVVIRIVSAFRSAERQAQIIRAKRARGVSIEEILTVSAPPGYSEHHSGRAVDLTTDGIKPLEAQFEQTQAYRWLQERAPGFGFRLSYPQGNSHGFAYEPWHWCFMEGAS